MDKLKNLKVNDVSKTYHIEGIQVNSIEDFIAICKMDEEFTFRFFNLSIIKFRFKTSYT
jgi:hypothetical protein